MSQQEQDQAPASSANSEAGDDSLDWLTDILTSVPTLVITVLGLATAYLTYKVARLQSDESRREGDRAASPVTSARELSTLERVQQLSVLRVGAIVADPWFMYAEGEATPTGIYPAIFSEIGERLGLTVVYTKIRNDVMFDYLEADTIDLAAQLLQTAERAQRAEYAALIHNVKLVAIVQKGQQKIKQFSDIGNSDVRCAVVRGEIGAEVARRQFKMTEDNDRVVSLTARYVPAIFYLLNDAVDVAITTGARWMEFQENEPTIAARLEVVCGVPLQVVPAGALVKKGELDFRDWLEEQTDIARRHPDVRAVEDRLIGEFDEAVVRI